MPEPADIAIFLPNPVGDVVMATPALRAAREHFASARITYVGRASALAVLEGTNWADEMILSRPDGLRGALATARILRKRRRDLGILLPNSFRCAAMCALARIRRRAGYVRDGRGWLLTDRLRPERLADGRCKPVPQIDYYARLAEFVGAPVRSRRMELPVTETDERAAETLLSEAGINRARPVVMLNPGAAFGVSKMWEPERFAAVADALVESRGAQILLNAAPMDFERRVAERVQKAMRHAPLLNFARRDNTLGLLKSLVRRCDLMITNDTGPRHFAAAFGIGLVTIFGSTDPVWAQIDCPSERTIRVDLPCSPCQRKLCPQPPGPQYHQCMSAIPPESVLHAACELLDERAKGGGA
ncbi:MAG TPA: ADP-heptose--LPS heptosyltransferase [Phycisphaerales bacterium]|nr:ADP-heptose--LPS heptosyltransferase [Phycisphaerales bacterium]